MLKPSNHPVALVAITLAAALAAGCQSTPRTTSNSSTATPGSLAKEGAAPGDTLNDKSSRSSMGASGTPSQMSNSPSNGPNSTSSTGATTAPSMGTMPNAGTGTSTDSGRASDK